MKMKKKCFVQKHVSNIINLDGDELLVNHTFIINSSFLTPNLTAIDRIFLLLSNYL